jgi:hypothetical protein
MTSKNYREVKEVGNGSFREHWRNNGDTLYPKSSNHIILSCQNIQTKRFQCYQHTLYSLVRCGIELQEKKPK